MTTNDGRRAPGTLEAEIMAALWQRDEPWTVTEVQAALGDGLAYNTVQTVLTRLHQKGLLYRRKAGRGYMYWPVQDASSEAAARMSAALSGRPDRQAVLRQFAASLDPADASVLSRLLADARPRNT
jgi:predicted transcriptional regulator